MLLYRTAEASRHTLVLDILLLAALLLEKPPPGCGGGLPVRRRWRWPACWR